MQNFSSALKEAVEITVNNCHTQSTQGTLYILFLMSKMKYKAIKKYLFSKKFVRNCLRINISI